MFHLCKQVRQVTRITCFFIQGSQNVQDQQSNLYKCTVSVSDRLLLIQIEITELANFVEYASTSTYMGLLNVLVPFIILR